MNERTAKSVEADVVRAVNDAVARGETWEGKVAITADMTPRRVRLEPVESIASYVHDDITMARLRKWCRDGALPILCAIARKSGKVTVWPVKLAVPDDIEQTRMVNGEACWNPPALLRAIFEADLAHVGPGTRGIVERFQRRAREVLAREPAGSTRTVGQILFHAWGKCPAMERPAAPGTSFGVAAEDLFAWLERPLRLAPEQGGEP